MEATRPSSVPAPAVPSRRSPVDGPEPATPATPETLTPPSTSANPPALGRVARAPLLSLEVFAPTDGEPKAELTMEQILVELEEISVELLRRPPTKPENAPAKEDPRDGAPG